MGLWLLWMGDYGFELFFAFLRARKSSKTTTWFASSSSSSPPDDLTDFPNSSAVCPSSPSNSTAPIFGITPSVSTHPSASTQSSTSSDLQLATTPTEMVRIRSYLPFPLGRHSLLSHLFRTFPHDLVRNSVRPPIRRRDTTINYVPTGVFVPNHPGMSRRESRLIHNPLFPRRVILSRNDRFQFREFDRSGVPFLDLLFRFYPPKLAPEPVRRGTSGFSDELLGLGFFAVLGEI